MICDWSLLFEYYIGILICDHITYSNGITIPLMARRMR